MCNKSFLDEGGLRSHHKHIHKPNGNQKIRCDICEKDFASVLSIKVHVRDIHDKLKNFKCHICTKSFAQNSQLSVHIKFVHQKLDVSNSRNFNCSECLAPCRSPHELKRHFTIVHLKIKKYECDICEKRFLVGHNIKKHMQNVHKVMGLSNHAKYQFSRKSKPIFDLKCEICNKSLKNEITLDVHKADVHGTKKKVFQCKICDKVFIYKRGLWSHELVHSGAKDHQCEICGTSFSTGSFMRSHIDRVHGKINK